MPDGHMMYLRHFQGQKWLQPGIFFFFNEYFSDKDFYANYLVYTTSFSSEACL